MKLKLFCFTIIFILTISSCGCFFQDKDEKYSYYLNIEAKSGNNSEYQILIPIIMNNNITLELLKSNFNIEPIDLNFDIINDLNSSYYNILSNESFILKSNNKFDNIKSFETFNNNMPNLNYEFKPIDEQIDNSYFYIFLSSTKNISIEFKIKLNIDKNDGIYRELTIEGELYNGWNKLLIHQTISTT